MSNLRHIVSAKDFSYFDLLQIFQIANECKKISKKSGQEAILKNLLIHNGRQLRFRILHSGPSTRTVGMFEDAIETLGGHCKTNPLEFSSISKGETHRSMLRILGPRCDCIIIRDDHDDHAATKMAEAADEYNLKTIIYSAGCGSREHPIQMLKDFFTIWERDETRLVSGKLTIALVGDLSHSRTIHSFLIGLKQFGGNIFLVGPEEENIPEWLEKEISNSCIIYKKIVDPLAIAKEVDYWYFTRIQDNLRSHKKEKMTARQRKKYLLLYSAHDDLRRTAKDTARFLHPLPAGDEYPEKIDLIDPRFEHFEQAENGLYVCEGLLKLSFAPFVNFADLQRENYTTFVSGIIENPIEIAWHDIQAVCAGTGCRSVRLTNFNWVRLHDCSIKEKLKYKPQTVCKECRLPSH